MNKTHLRRSLTAMGTALVCLMAMTNPAGAAVHDLTINGGTITSFKSGVTETFTLGTTTSCATTTLTADFGTETLGGSIGVTAFGASHVQAYSNGSSYLTVLSRSTTGNSNGAWTSGSTTSHLASSIRMALVATIYNTTSCTPTTPVCTVAAALQVTSTFSTSLASSAGFNALATGVFTVVAFPTCTAGPSQILGTVLVTTSPITGHITT